jgi:hypothetical protein
MSARKPTGSASKRGRGSSASAKGAGKTKVQDPGVVATSTSTSLKLKGENFEHILGEAGESALHKRGYRSAKATHGVDRGAWYFEVECLKGNHPHGFVRVGWATSQSNLELPVGYDAGAYAYRGQNGDKINTSFRQPCVVQMLSLQVPVG